MRHYVSAALLALPLLMPFTAQAKDMDDADRHTEMCSDHYAHAFGKLAFLQAKLGITDKQQDAWAKWQQAELNGATKERDACLAEKPPEDKTPSILDQEDKLEAMLSAKLTQLQAAREPLNDLYKVLTAAQKDEFDEFGAEERHHWHEKHGEMGDHGLDHGPDHKPD